MQPSQSGVSAARPDALGLDSTGVSETATPTAIANVQQSQYMPTEQASPEESVSAPEAYTAVEGSEVSTGEVAYQIADNVDETSTSNLQVENGTGEGGHVVVVRDDGAKSGQPRKIICYIHGDLPSNVTSDMAFIQQIIDKTEVVHAEDTSTTTDENTTVQAVVAGDVNVPSPSEITGAQVMEGLDQQFTNVVYGIPTTVNSNNATSLGFDTLIQDATNEDQVVVITTDLHSEDSGTLLSDVIRE